MGKDWWGVEDRFIGVEVNQVKFGDRVGKSDWG